MMQKQRSPYTGGGFNLQQLKATTFSKTPSSNNMPFLVQLVQQVQVQQRPQRLSSLLASKKACQSAHASHSGHERGIRASTPRSYRNNSSSSFNSNYEVEMPPLSLGQSHLSTSLPEDCNRIGRMDNDGNNMDNMGDMSNMDNMGHMDCMAHMEAMGHMDNMENMDNLGHLSHMDQVDNVQPSDSMSSIAGMGGIVRLNNLAHMDDMGPIGQIVPNDNMGDMDNMTRTSKNNSKNSNNISSHSDEPPEPSPMTSKAYSSETDSETEYCQYMGLPEESKPQVSRWTRLIDYLRVGLPPQRQERVEAAMLRCCESSFFNNLILVLQLLCINGSGIVISSLRVGINFTQLGFRLWRCKFQLRSLLRQMLWRMANAKGTDVLLFLGVMLVSPWLFVISLVGFSISFLFHTKEAVGFVVRQLRTQML